MSAPEPSIAFSLSSMVSHIQGNQPPVVLSAAQILEMQGLLIAEYKKAEFQAKLHRAWGEVGTDALARAKVQQALRLRVQLPIITRFGYEASEKGLAQMSKAAEATEHTPQMLGNQKTLKWLLDPGMQSEQPGLVLDAQVPVQGPEWIRPRHLRQRGSRWVVVGGTGRGILVRRGAALDSAPYRYRLCTGAELRAEEEVVGSRLHYRRLSGDGPDFGWVSIEAEGKVLVKPDIDGYVRELDADGGGVLKDGPEFYSNKNGMQYQLEKILREQAELGF